MQTIEFETELRGDDSLDIPQEIASRLPQGGRARVILVFDGDNTDEVNWRRGAYEQFMREDDAEDAVYDDASYL